MQILQIVWIAGGAAVVAAIGWMLLRGRDEKAQKRKVHATLRQYAALRGYKVLEHITLDDGKRQYHADYVLAGFFGLLFVNVLTQPGDYYGDDREERWTIVKAGEKTYLNNPLAQGVAMMDAARRMFAKNDVYNISMEQVVVLTPSFRKHTLNIKETLPVLPAGKLRAFLNKSRFEQDNGVNVDQLASLLGAFE